MTLPPHFTLLTLRFSPQVVTALLLSIQLSLPLPTSLYRLFLPHSHPTPLLTPCLPCLLAPLRSGPFPPPLLHGVGRPLYPVLNNHVQLETPTCRICLVPRRPHYELGNGPTERLPDPYGVHPRTLIQCNKSTCHHRTVRSPGRGGVSHPVCQIDNDDSELLLRTPKAKEPIPQLNRLCSERPSGA